jgi:predicted esterase
MAKEVDTLNGDASKLFIGGFSHGVNVILASFLLYKGPALGGVFCSSGFFCAQINWGQVDMKEKNKTPIYLLHGENDVVIPEIYARASYQKLKSKGLEPNIQVERDCQHHFSHDCMRFLYNFIALKMDTTLTALVDPDPWVNHFEFPKTRKSVAPKGLEEEP